MNAHSNLRYPRPRGVFVAAPVWVGSKPFFDDFFRCWRKLSYPDTVFCIAENNLSRPGIVGWSTESAFVRRPGDLRIEIVDTEQGWHCGWSPLTAAQNRIRSAFLASDCEYLYISETSRPSPPNLIETLLSAQKPVIGALYKSTHNPGFYCAWDFDIARDRHIPDPYALINEISEPTQVFGLGFGAILIHRSILQQLEFRSANYAADTYFAVDLARLGIPIFASPVLIENLKIDREPRKLREWNEARTIVLDCIGSDIEAISETLYAGRLRRTLDEIFACIPRGMKFVLVDSDEWRTPDFVDGRHRLIFRERDGEHGGPINDDAAIRAFDRLSRAGVEFAVFGWPAFWYFGCYPKLAHALRSSYPCLLDNDRAIVFDLRPRGCAAFEGKTTQGAR